ncbi:protein app1 isoform X5 [Glycine max]|uniref:protein app1 isoform X5 n=1 Tax=Glycine max TaxID=3847 RepID=UPI0007193037|nr:protein app1 isoform X5 [Glycine max]|eukprot:XP_014628137.1 protein app1 isoform X5 [Glycine max]
MPRKAKCSKKRPSRGISNLVPLASSQGHSAPVEPSLQPSTTAQPCAPMITIIPPSVPTAQNMVSTSDPPSHTIPHKAKRSNKRVCRGISNLVPHASSQGHSAPVEPPLKPSKVARPRVPIITFIPPSIPTAQNLVSASDPPLRKMSRKAKFSRERASLGISNLMPFTSSHGHSTHVEPPLQPSQVAQSCAPTITLVPPSIATTQNMVSPSDPLLHKVPHKAKHSKKRGSHDISNLMPHASSQGHSRYVEPPLQPSELAQFHAPTLSHIPSSIPIALDPLSRSVPPQNVFSGILNLIHQAAYQGYSLLEELPQPPSNLAQPCAPTITDIPPSIPTVQDLVSPSNLPKGLMPRKAKHSKKRVSRSLSNLMPRASSQGHCIPMELPLQPSELAQPCAPPVVLDPSSIPVIQDPVSSSDPSSIPVNQDPASPSDPSSIPANQDLASPSDPSSIRANQDPVSPSDPSASPVTEDLSLHTIVPPSTVTHQPLAPYFRHCRGREWAVQAIDQHGNTKEIQVTKADVFLMPPGQHIVVPFDGQLRAYGDAATLLSGACGRIVTDSKNVPINFESWTKVPKSYKDNCFNILKTLFHFQASESTARRYCLLTMSRKYRNGKHKLWTSAFDPSLSREQLIAKVPYGIPEDQWLSFIDNHLKPEYQELCRKNAVVRQKQTVPHTGGAKLLSRKQHEMEVELGRPISRVELYIATRKKKDGSFVNEEARSIGEKMTQEISECANPTEISTNDALAKVLGRDHCGRVRCLGLGGLHSVAFQSTEKFSGTGRNLSNSNSVESSQLKEEVTSLKTKLAASEENVKTLQNIMLTYIQMKEGHIPKELGALFDTNVADENSGEDMSTSESGSSLDSNRH